LKLSAITISVISIVLLSMMLTSATTEMSGGMSAVAENGGYISGTLKPGITCISLGDTDLVRAISEDEVQGFSALFANDDNTLGTVTAARFSRPPGGSTVKDPAKCYALLKFEAPVSPINTLLIQSSRPSSISPDQFKEAVLNAGATWNDNGVVARDFYGTVSDAPSGTQSLAHDHNFVQSFQYSSNNWLAATYFDSREFYSTASITDADTIYNSRYAYSTDTTKTQKANLRFVDLQAVALHEMGHPIGLDDIYNKPTMAWDTSEVMNSYIWGMPRYTLGVGDKSGLKAKYPGDVIV
jgi:hypothetical protein